MWPDSGYRDAQSRVDREVKWHVAARPSDLTQLPEGKARKRLQQREHCKASVRTKAEHPCRVIKRQFGLTKVRFKGLQKNTAHLLTLFALSNVWMARLQLSANSRSPTRNSHSVQPDQQAPQRSRLGESQPLSSHSRNARIIQMSSLIGPDVRLLGDFAVLLDFRFLKCREL